MVKDPRVHRYVFTCLACKDFSTRSCRLSVRSSSHNKKVLDFLGLRVGPTGLPTGNAPTQEEFLQAWRGAAKGSNETDQAGRGKVGRMHAHLCEALRQRQREFMRKASTMSIKRDESDGRVIVRAQAATPKLESMSFMLGMRKYTEGCDAYDITEVTGELLDHFAKGDAKLMEHMRNILEAVCVDAASAETTSARLMMTHPRGNPVAPNLKAVIRDRAHASRRMISRPWQADEKVNEVTQELIMGNTSIVQRIYHSKLFTEWYKRYVQQSPRIEVRTGDLGAAKHRYESWAKPMAQFILTFPAIIAVAQDISVTRVGNQEAKDAYQFLTDLTEEKVLLIALLADAADEALAVTRAFDREDTDISRQAGLLHAFRVRIRNLLESGQVFKLPGFTLAACRMLEEPMYVTPSSRELRPLGGLGRVTEDLKERCLRHLRAWVHVCGLVIEAEFPDFDLVHAFSAFDLTYAANELNEEMRDSLRHLSLQFRVDEETLQREFTRVMPLARAQMTRYNCSSQEAWRRAAANRRDCTSLQFVLQRAIGWGVSTSGVERNFAARPQPFGTPLEIHGRPRSERPRPWWAARADGAG